MTDRPPYVSQYDLANLPEKGIELVLKPNAAERAEIAAWLEIEALEGLVGSVRLTRNASGRYLYRGHLDADVVQACVVTLEPVPAHISQDFEREFELAPPVPKRGKRRTGVNASAKPVIEILDDNDAPDIIESPVIDIAAPMIEELSLSLDPYPRKAGVSFTAPEDLPGTVDNPFAVLQKLKGS